MYFYISTKQSWLQLKRPFKKFCSFQDDCKLYLIYICMYLFDKIQIS